MKFVNKTLCKILLRGVIMKKERYQNPIYDNDFSKHILVHMNFIFEKHKDENEEFIRNKNMRKKLTVSELYIADVAHYLFNISNIVDQLSQISVYIEHYPNLKAYENNGITKDEYLKYHLQNYFIRTSTIIDQIAILVNEVYRLGLTPYRCSVEAILDNSNIKDLKIARLIKSLNKAVGGIKAVRNKFVHRGIFDDKDILDLATYIFLNEQREEELIPESQINQLHKKIIQDKINLISSNNEAVIKYVLAIYDLLLEPFESNYKTLSKKK